MRRLVLLAFIWGWSFLFIKVAVEGLTPPTVAAARIALGAAVLVALVRVRRLSLPTDRATWRHMAVAALLGNVLPFTLLAWGEERITSALTSVLNASTPLFTAVAVGLLLRERLRPLQIVGLALGFVGVGVAAGFGSGDLSDSSVSGGLAAVGAGLCYGLGFAYVQRFLMDIPREVAAAGQLVAGTVVLGPIAIVSSATSGLALTPTRLLAVVLLGVIGTGTAYVLYYRLLGDVGPTRASLVTYLVPVVAVAVGVVVLDEDPSIRLLFGGVLIVADIVFVNGLPLSWRRARRTPAALPA